MWAAPEMVKNVTLYQGKLPLFEGYGIAKDVESIFSRKVWLKSGGYIIIEHTEAMVVVDVNSGRYAAKREQEENSLKTNLEAAREVVRQLRLRDIGGIIVVDFIDMLDQKNAKKVYDSMKTELRNDRAKARPFVVAEQGIGRGPESRQTHRLFRFGEKRSWQRSGLSGPLRALPAVYWIGAFRQWPFGR